MNVRQLLGLPLAVGDHHMGSWCSFGTEVLRLQQLIPI
jgi:hypothetical protein